MMELEQTVILFNDSNKTAKQFVTIDHKDGWIIVTHDGNCLSMSIDNWIKLVGLASDIIKNNDNEEIGDRNLL